MEGRTRNAGQQAMSKSGVDSPASPHKTRKRDRVGHNVAASEEQRRNLLVELFPGRKGDIDELLSVLGEPEDMFPPLLVYGGAATGKTSVVRETMALLGRPFAYVSCRSCHSPRLLFESVLNQLVGHVRCKANNYASARKCERMMDFLSQLGDACSSAADDKRMVYLVFDDVQLIRGWPGGGPLMSSLITLSSLARQPNLGLIFVSSAGPDTFQLSLAASREPIPLHFRDYTNEELYSILVKWKPSSELYSFFLRAALAPFSRMSRRVSELSEGLHPLYEKYCDSVVYGKENPKDKGKREVFSYLKCHLQPALSQSFSISQSDSGGRNGEGRCSGVRRSSSQSVAMEFHLSRCSKYLLLASYIASRNPSTLDDALFGSGDDAKNKRRKRKSSMSAMEKQDAEMQKKHLKGPSNCSLERLLAIYQCISVESDSSLEAEKSIHFSLQKDVEGNACGVSADVLLQLATLSSVNLVLRSSSSPLDGFPRFRSNTDTDFIRQVARTINFPLSKYLLHG